MRYCLLYRVVSICCVGFRIAQKSTQNKREKKIKFLKWKIHLRWEKSAWFYTVSAKSKHIASQKHFLEEIKKIIENQSISLFNANKSLWKEYNLTEGISVTAKSKGMKLKKWYIRAKNEKCKVMIFFQPIFAHFFRPKVFLKDFIQWLTLN